MFVATRVPIGPRGWTWELTSENNQGDEVLLCIAPTLKKLKAKAHSEWRLDLDFPGVMVKKPWKLSDYKKEEVMP